MANAEIIGLLCAGTTRYHPAGGRGGSSTEVLRRYELAGLLAGMSEPMRDLMLACYADDIDSERRLIAHVRVWLAGVAVDQDWRVIRSRPTIMNMAALAVLEVVRPNRCDRCRGVGHIGAHICMRCDGTGFRKLSGRRISEVMGVDPASYARTWRARYDFAFRYVQNIDYDANKILKKQMPIRLESLSDSKA